METTEKIVEAYVRYVKGWATIPNIRCPGQKEIDLLALDPRDGSRYHIESGVSVSQKFSSLTAKPFDKDLLRVRVQKPSQRRTLGYFLAEKFTHPDVQNALARYNFAPGNYTKVIVTWGADDEARVQARAAGVDVWDFRRIVREISESVHGKRTYFTDDTLRTIHLFSRALGDRDGRADDDVDSAGAPVP
ncbi:MAG: hypothetical protein FJ087_18485 [Deltaproteobacteria bacterium]|nr:hypothetical protein [Deltaproteobacteria bacterium]